MMQLSSKLEHLAAEGFFCNFLRTLPSTLQFAKISLYFRIRGEAGRYFLVERLGGLLASIEQ